MVHFKAHFKAMVSRAVIGATLLVLANLIGSSYLKADMIDSIEELFSTPEKKPGETETPVEKKKDGEQAQATEPSETEDIEPEIEATSKPSEPAKPVNQASRKERAKQPIRLESEGRTTYARSGGLIHLRKNVVITQADLRLRADEAKVHVDEGQKDNSIKKVEVIGQVKITKSDADPSKRVTARGQQGEFLNSKQEIILSGNARLWRGGHLIRGKKIIYNLVSGLISVDEAVGVVQPKSDDGK